MLFRSMGSEKNASLAACNINSKPHHPINIVVNAPRVQILVYFLSSIHNALTK